MHWFALLLIAGFAFGVSVATVSFIRRIALRVGLLDQPNARKVHQSAIPLGGGIGIWFGVVCTFAVGTSVVWLASFDDTSQFFAWAPTQLQKHLPGLWIRVSEVWILIGCGSLLALLGLLDDKFHLPWYGRLGAEFAIAWFVVVYQDLNLTIFIQASWVTNVLSILWIVTLVNSFNMLDNMDGLAGGVATLCALMLGLFLLVQPSAGNSQPQLFVAMMLFALAGSTAGFLVHNWAPAKIFMGDSGSYFIGYWLAVSSLLATYTESRSDTPHAVLAPLCIFAVPLYDTLSVIWIRIREGRSPFEGDKRHFSHRLVDIGFTKTTAVLTIYLVVLTCSLSGLILPRTDLIGAGLSLAAVVCSLLVIAALESTKGRSQERE